MINISFSFETPQEAQAFLGAYLGQAQITHTTTKETRVVLPASNAIDGLHPNVGLSHNNEPYTCDDEAYIISHISHRHKEIAEHLGRSTKSIQVHICNMRKEGKLEPIKRNKTIKVPFRSGLTIHKSSDGIHIV
jgi:hypothetical protein